VPPIHIASVTHLAQLATQGPSFAPQADSYDFHLNFFANIGRMIVLAQLAKKRFELCGVLTDFFAREHNLPTEESVLHGVEAGVALALRRPRPGGFQGVSLIRFPSREFL
jgi:hypothetical protein